MEMSYSLVPSFCLALKTAEVKKTRLQPFFFHMVKCRQTRSQSRWMGEEVEVQKFIFHCTLRFVTAQNCIILIPSVTGGCYLVC